MSGFRLNHTGDILVTMAWVSLRNFLKYVWPTLTLSSITNRMSRFVIPWKNDLRYFFGGYITKGSLDSSFISYWAAKDQLHPPFVMYRPKQSLREIEIKRERERRAESLINNQWLFCDRRNSHYDLRLHLVENHRFLFSFAWTDIHVRSTSAFQMSQWTVFRSSVKKNFQVESWSKNNCYSLTGKRSRTIDNQTVHHYQTDWYIRELRGQAGCFTPRSDRSTGRELHHSEEVCSEYDYKNPLHTLWILTGLL